jgi:hypothetical protein
MTKKITQLTEDTTPSLLDMLETAKTPDGTPASRKVRAVYLAALAAPDGVLVNGKISPTVATNNLTLTILTADGSTPSSTNPVGVKINGTVRMITAATTCTLAAATSWMNLGAAEFATLEQDLFAYAVWDSNSSVVAVAPSRIPYGRLVSDFSATTTNEKHLGNYANYTATDDVVNIGRFAATLSAGVAYTWTVPTYTNLNLIQRPIYETRWLVWTPTLAGWSANPTVACAYKESMDGIFWNLHSTGVGTSNATTTTFTLPFTVTTTNSFSVGRGQDNGAECAPTFRATASGNICDCFKGPGNTVWTNTGTKFLSGQGFFRIA